MIFIRSRIKFDLKIINDELKHELILILKIQIKIYIKIIIRNKKNY